MIACVNGMLMRALLVDFPANAALSAIHTTSFMITLASLGTRMDIGFMLISWKGFPLWSFLRDVTDAAHHELRDVAPVRMIWWLSCEVPPATQTLLDEMMAYF